MANLAVIDPSTNTSDFFTMFRVNSQAYKYSPKELSAYLHGVRDFGVRRGNIFNNVSLGIAEITGKTYTIQFRYPVDILCLSEISKIGVSNHGEEECKKWAAKVNEIYKKFEQERLEIFPKRVGITFSLLGIVRHIGRQNLRITLDKLEHSIDKTAAIFKTVVILREGFSISEQFTFEESLDFNAMLQLSHPENYHTHTYNWTELMKSIQEQFQNRMLKSKESLHKSCKKRVCREFTQSKK